MRWLSALAVIALALSFLAAQTVDSTHRGLREAVPAESFSVENFKIVRDVAEFTLRTGTVTFLTPVQNKHMLAVFRGDATFDLSPATGLDRDSLKKLTGQEKATVTVQRMLLAFSDSTYDEITKTAKSTALDSEAAGVLADFRKKIRKNSDGNDNIEAELLMDLYNPNREPSFMAFMNGRGADDLRFFVRPYGALSGFPPEEVALILESDSNERGGIWYLSHRVSEWQQQKATSAEQKAAIDVDHYTIDANIAANTNLNATAAVKFTALRAGDRVLKFDLVPTLRVKGVTYDGPGTIPFIQEKKEEDAGLYVILPSGLLKGTQHTVTITYAGDHVIFKEGSGNFFVGARESWYPSVSAFNDRASFDITFHYPKRYTLVSVGDLIKETSEKDETVAQWKSDIPLAVAGFNYGEFKRKSQKDPATGFVIEALANETMTNDLRDFSNFTELEKFGVGGATWTPSALMDRAISETAASVQIYNQFFGPIPYKRIAITQQPAFNFGQSWPSLVYLPVIAFLDSTQRYALFQDFTFKLNDFIQEVTPHEVAHQWWGHLVGWMSYHDQWLSEGFADFSASLFLQATRKNSSDFVKFWEHSREEILNKNRYGQSPNDAGPLWLGIRLSTPKNPNGYNGLVYPKGAYVLHMLRYMMWDGATHDENFIAMMKDFVKTHENKNASTESFKAVVEKHMTPVMDLERNHHMDWFFREWVYGSDVPHYRLEYSFAQGDNGRTIVKGKLTQSGVSDQFKMIVPLYIEVANGNARLGQLPIAGNQTRDFEVPLQTRPKRVFLNLNQDVLAYEATSTETR